MTLVNVLTGEDFGVRRTSRSTASRTSRCGSRRATIRPTLAIREPEDLGRTSRAQRDVHHRLAAAPGNPVDPVSAVADAQQRVQRVRARRSDQVGHGLGVDVPDEALLLLGHRRVTKLFQRNFTATGACDDVSDHAVRSRRAYDRLADRTSRRRRPTQTDSLCWEANVITFNNTNVFGSKNVANIPTTFANGWVALNFNGSSVPAGRHQLVGGVSTDVQHRDRFHGHARLDDVQRPADHRLRRDHVRQRHAHGCRWRDDRSRTTAATSTTRTRRTFVNRIVRRVIASRAGSDSRPFFAPVRRTTPGIFFFASTSMFRRYNCAGFFTVVGTEHA